MAMLIDGKKISMEIKEELKRKVLELKENGALITLVVIQVGSDVASSVYVANKKKSLKVLHKKSYSSWLKN